jgi:hypothetical protein
LRTGRTLLLVAACLAAAAGVAGWWSARAKDSPAPREARSEEPPPLEVLGRREAVPAPAGPPPESVPPRTLARASAFADANRRAIEALERGEVEQAVALFEQCVAGEPDEPVFRHNLAEALVRRAVDQRERVRPCEPCLEWLERAVALSPEREPIRQLLERWKAEAEAEKEFLRDRSVHFELSYDGWREALLDAAPAVLDELERHYIDLAELFGVQPGERGAPRLPVVLYRHDQFTQITGLDWAGASYDGTIRVPIAEGRGLDASLSTLLRHELIHAFVREAGGPAVPAWLNEGLAQLLQPDAARELDLARAALRSRELVPLDALRAAFAKLPSAEPIAVAYAESLLFTAFLDHAYGRETLVRMVRGCRESGDPAAAFEAWTRVPLATAFDDFAASLR